MNNLTYEQVLSLIQHTSEQIAATEMQIKTLSLEAEKRAQETEKQIMLASAEAEKRAQETEKQLKALARQVGDVTDTLGRFAEEQVRPRILDMFRERGIPLRETYQRVKVEKEGEFLLEIDLLLVNTVYSVVVEVKNTLRHRDIDTHLDRMAKLQENPTKAIRGTTMYGAVAGLIMSNETELYAIKNGFFVIKPKGEGVEISNKPDFKPNEWKTEDSK